MKGRADYLALGDWNAICYECGRKFKASQLVRHWQGYYVCTSCWEPRQPQDFVRAVVDNQTPPWTQPQPTDSFGTARLSTSGTTAGNSGIVPETLYIAEVPWTPGGSTITDFDLTDYITPPSTAGTILVNIPNGVTIDGSFGFGTGWAVGTEFVINNNGNVTVVPDFPANSTVTMDGVAFGEAAADEDYTVKWVLGRFPAPVLVFTTQPTNTSLYASTSPAVVVQVSHPQDLSAVDTLIFNVQLSIHTNPGDPEGTLSGTTSAATSSGVATFSDLSIDQPGDGYVLKATIEGTNILAVLSNAFNIVATLAFTQQPSDVAVDTAIDPAVTVTAQGVSSETITGFTESISIVIGTNPGGGTLSGTTTKAAVAGVATFDDLEIDATGDGYTLIASVE